MPLSCCAPDMRSMRNGGDEAPKMQAAHRQVGRKDLQRPSYILTRNDVIFRGFWRKRLGLVSRSSSSARNSADGSLDRYIDPWSSKSDVRTAKTLLQLGFRRASYSGPVHETSPYCHLAHLAHVLP